MNRWITSLVLPQAIVGAINRPLALVRSRRVPRGVTRRLRVRVGPPAAELAVWVMEPKISVRGTVFALPGIHGHKGMLRRTGEQLAGAGYRALLVDLRGHGESSGRWLTFGVQEARDLAQVLDALERDGVAVGPVGAFGTSYGAACALQWAAHDARVRAVVSVAAFATMIEEVPCFMRGGSRIPRWLVTDAQIQTAITQAGKLASFDPAEASPLAAIGRIRAPVLLLHGECDAKTPAEQARRLWAAAGASSELRIVPGAGHDRFFRDHAGLIARETREWFDRWLKVPAVGLAIEAGGERNTS